MSINDTLHSELLVSIIIPCYNQDIYLRETFQSILDQEYLNWEALIIDDGSKDNTKAISMEWSNKDTRFKYFYKANGGLSDARNYGIKKALGAYIQFLDSDDLLSSQKLLLQVQSLHNSQADVSICTSEYFYDDNYDHRFINNFCLDQLLFKQVYGNDLFDHFLTDNRVPVSSPLLRKEVIDEAGLFDIKLRSLEDWDYWFRILFLNKIFNLDFTSSPQTSIRVRNNSMSTNKTTMTLSRIVVFKKILESKNTCVDKHRRLIKFYIKDNIKQYLYQIDNTMNYQDLFKRLEDQSATPFQYKLYKFFFSFNLFSHKKLLWLIFDISPSNLISLFKKKLKNNAH